MTKLPPHLAKKTPAELEALCSDCGACCAPAVELDNGDKIIVPDITCKHLKRDDDGRTRCSVYTTRLDKNVAGNWCRDLATGIVEGIFPKACPYVIDMPGYEGPKIYDVPTYALVRRRVARTVTAHERPEWADVAAWQSLTERAR